MGLRAGGAELHADAPQIVQLERRRALVAVQFVGILARRYIVNGMPFALRLMASAARHRVRRGGTGAVWG